MKPNIPLPHKTPKFGLLQAKEYENHIEKMTKEREKLEKTLKQGKENKFSISKSFSKEKQIDLISKKEDNSISKKQKDSLIRQRSKDSLMELNCDNRNHSVDFYNLCEDQETLQNDSIKKLEEYKERDPKEKESKPKIQDKIKFINDLFENIQNKREIIKENEMIDSSPETSMETLEIPSTKPAIPIEKPENPIKFIYNPKNIKSANNYKTDDENEVLKRNERISYPEKQDKILMNKNDCSLISIKNEEKQKQPKEKSPLVSNKPLTARPASEYRKANHTKHNEEKSFLNDFQKSPNKKAPIFSHKSTKSTNYEINGTIKTANYDNNTNNAIVHRPKSPLKKSIVKNLMEANKLKNGIDKKIYKAYENVLKSFEKDAEWNREQNRKSKSPLKIRNFENAEEKKCKSSISPLKKAERSPLSRNKSKNEKNKNIEGPRNIKKFYQGKRIVLF
jgi:hypothetical protein